MAVYRTRHVELDVDAVERAHDEPATNTGTDTHSEYPRPARRSSLTAIVGRARRSVRRALLHTEAGNSTAA